MQGLDDLVMQLAYALHGGATSGVAAGNKQSLEHTRERLD